MLQLELEAKMAQIESNAIRFAEQQAEKLRMELHASQVTTTRISVFAVLLHFYLSDLSVVRTLLPSADGEVTA